jgi:hypothetical protein
MTVVDTFTANITAIGIDQTMYAVDGIDGIDGMMTPDHHAVTFDVDVFLPVLDVGLGLCLGESSSTCLRIMAVFLQQCRPPERRPGDIDLK